MRGHHWWGAILALLAALFVGLTTGIIGVSVYVSSGVALAPNWLPHLVPAAVLAFALLGLAGALVVAQDDGVGAERGWLALAHVIAPLSMLLGVPLLCAGRYSLLRRYEATFTPAWAVMAVMLTAVGVTALVLLSARQLASHPRGRRARLAWLMSMNLLCLGSFAALVLAEMFVVVPSTCCPW
jgi:hypothetical protein